MKPTTKKFHNVFLGGSSLWGNCAADKSCNAELVHHHGNSCSSTKVGNFLENQNDLEFFQSCTLRCPTFQLYTPPSVKMPPILEIITRNFFKILHNVQNFQRNPNF